MAYEAYHKGFNMNGSGEKDFKDSVGNEDGNQRLHLTMAYNKVSNIIQRFPLVRQGTVNIINCCLDNSGHKAAAEALGRTVTTTAASARAGASVGMDTCVFDGVDRIVEGNERNLRDGNNKEWGDVFVNARNHTLIVNSKIKGAGENGGDYVGSSWDNGGDNPFIGDAAAYWNDGKSTLGSFAWFSHIENVDQYVREQLPDAPFTFTYDEKLPYDYQVLPLEEVEDTVGKYAGAYVLNEEPEFWLSTEYSADSTIKTAEEKGVYIPAEDLKLDIGAEGMALYVDEMKQITADIVPSHAADRVIQWISSDPEVLEIKDSGLAIARKEGKATVTASIERKDGRTVSKAVTVSVLVPLVNELIIENAPKTIYLGDENTPAERIQLKVKALPENAGNKEVTWTSSNPDVLQVDENGVLTPVKAGSGVRITCTSLGNPEVSVSARISVRAGANPNPSQTPSEEPSEAPSLAPSEKPSEAPSQAPSEEPSEAPSQAPSEEPSEAPTRQPAVLGDLDGDGRAASEDALMILQYVVKLRKLTAGQLDAADMNGDGETTADDALLVLQKAVRLISEVFPAGK